MTLRVSLAVLALSLSSVLMAQDAATTTEPAAAGAATDPATPAAAAEPAAAAVVEAAPAAPGPGNADAGAAKGAVCGACHGMDGNSADPQYPKLAGQSEGYIASQLAQFKSMQRMNPIMLGFSAALSEQDMRDLGAHFAKQKVQPGVADDSVIADPASPYKGQRIVDVGQKLFRGGDAARGVPACMSCHGPSGRGVPGPSYPAVAGQHAGYASLRLQAFKTTPAGSPALQNANYAVMAQIAARLSDEEITALASYLQGLHTAAEVTAR